MVCSNNDNLLYNDWRWQIRNSIKTAKQLSSHVQLSDDEVSGLASMSDTELPLQITPHYLSLIDPHDPQCPIRRQVIAQRSEFEENDLLRRDPLGEEDHEVVPNLVHRYPDRVLLLITDRCASYCRFCTRKRWVGQGPSPTRENLDAALEYIANNPQIEEVILSGGDALILSDENLKRVLTRIRAIEHVQIIRIASRMLSFAPMRITENLIQILRAFQPVYILTHFNHLKEFSESTREAIRLLVDAGVPLVNQTVLLKGVNDNKEDLTRLFKELVRLRVRPYYLHQCDVVMGTRGFRVKLSDALELYSSLRGHVSGLCLPTFVVDIPGGYGKVPLHKNPIEYSDEKSIYLRGFDNEVGPYPLD